MAPTLVVVGLGVAGAKVAHGAVKSKLFNVISIDPKEFFEVPYAAVRAVVDPSVANKSLFPYADIPGGIGKHIRASAIEVKGGAVVLDNGEAVQFDYLVISTGAKHTGQGVITAGATTLAGRKAELQAAAECIKAAKSIAVIGGGPVGLEVVGEIVEAYAGKTVTIIHGGATLLNGAVPKLHTNMMHILSQHKVQVLLNDRADKIDEEGKVVTTRSGKQVPADLVFWAAGSRANAGMLARGDLAGLLDVNGRATVDESLRLKGHPNVFVLGDANDTPQAKLGFLANLQADLTVANLKKLAAGNKTLAKWAPPMQPKGAMFVTFGKSGGVGHVASCMCGGWAVSKIKGQDLFVGQARKEFGLSA